MWLLLFRAESIWVAWIHLNVIKDKNIWEIKEKQKHTWLFKEIMRLRDVVQQWVITLPGNGRRCRFWYDSWTPFEPLITFIGPLGPRQTGIQLSANVAYAWHRGGWHLWLARSPEVEQLMVNLTTISLTDSEDTYQWIING